ncbi:MAG: winged helix-turn-helix transcriptional regulator [Sulfolobales archaeon]
MMRVAELSGDLITRAINLLRIRKYITNEDLARELGLSNEGVNTLLGVLLAEGIIDEVRITHQGSTCPLRCVCSVVGGCKG